MYPFPLYFKSIPYWIGNTLLFIDQPNFSQACSWSESKFETRMLPFIAFPSVYLHSYALPSAVGYIQC